MEPLGQIPSITKRAMSLSRVKMGFPTIMKNCLRILSIFAFLFQFEYGSFEGKEA